jgi:hypothetical protein
VYFFFMIPPQAHLGLRPSISPLISTTTWQPQAKLVQCQRSLAFINMTFAPPFAPLLCDPREYFDAGVS